MKLMTDAELLDAAERAVLANGALPQTIYELAQFFDYFQTILSGEQSLGQMTTSTRRHRWGAPE